MQKVVEEHLKRNFVTDLFLMTHDFTYQELYAIANYRKDA